MDKRICVVGCDLGPGPMAYLREQFPEFEFLSYPRNAKVPDEVLARAEVLMNYGDKSQIAPAKNVRYIHTISAGIDGYIDEVDRCHGSALPVTNGAGVYSDAVGEHVIALLLAVVHGIVPSVRNMAEKQWPAIPMLGNVNGKTIAVLGTGDIGNNAARICAAMGARVLGFKLHACEPFPPYSEIYTGDDGLDALLPQADAVLVCLPGSPFTKDMLDARRIGLMKAGSVLVNIGRGSIVNTEALMEALRSGHIAAAGLDVTDPEPLPPDHPLWDCPNVLITPHISGLGASKQKHAEWFAENLRAYLESRPQPGAVNREMKY
ncbi:MAG TPA: D-2-hydroxyacid dehydrogenase [Candidatus Spyradocola merdavium]|nr:D-2-hydroxyacid dehydrogenase [Candidatus Spyradocola merdavium]